jgi:outer membrane protein assembly factor BamD
MASFKNWSSVIKIFLGTFFVANCGGSEMPYEEKPMSVLHKTADTLFKKQEYEKAADAFDEIDRQYPHDKSAAKAQLQSAYCAFKAQKFARAISTLDVFIELNPASPQLAYAYYLRALCYYIDISPVLRDKENAQLALQAFNEVIQCFPGTEYAQDARFKRDFVIQHLACQDMCVAKEYLQNKEFIAALIRFNRMVTEYPTSVLMPEVLYRIAECQILLGLFQSAPKTLSMLEYNFPKTLWYQKAYQLLQKYTPHKTNAVVKK